jgi:hypothetical protein
VRILCAFVGLRSPSGPRIRIEISVIDGVSSHVGTVTVRFAELPVHEWHGVSDDEKRAKGTSPDATTLDEANATLSRH